jgi:hypothetical protein
MNDFDYIQDGGFVIECKDGHVVGVSKEQGDVIHSEFHFLDNCFRHGTTKAASRILKNPDWSVAIDVLCEGKTTVSTLQLYEELIQAGYYACLDLRLCSLVNYLDITDKEGTQHFSTLVETPASIDFNFKRRWNPLGEFSFWPRESCCITKKPILSTRWAIIKSWTEWTPWFGIGSIQGFRTI